MRPRADRPWRRAARAIGLLSRRTPVIASFVHQLKFAVTAVACCAALAPVAHAQDSYPSRPTRLVVGFSPGGPVDVGARLLGEHLSRTMGTTFLVENRVGANAMIAAESVKRAAPDGYTVFVSSSSAITLSPVLHKNTIRYNPEEDFAPVATIMEMPLILVVNNNDPKMKSVRTLQDLVELAKKNPGQITYGSAGPGNITQIAFEVLSSRAGIQMVHIPYKGTASAQSAILANEVNMVFDSLSVMAHIKSGAVRPLAISSNRRLAELPDVPTVQEAGYGDFNVASWVGLFVPKATPQAVIERLNKEVDGALKDKELAAKLTVQGPVLAMSPEEFQQRIRKESAELVEVVEKANISIN
ncbi:tripartite tricarboxylate transporter family receptor [Bordetella bronchiseptica MBORD678]|nr:tripartite tricarboxylate transporter family receptor [Bordetella bronchiseptica 3E44]KCV57920.1 tripartite tricarboxylate transporter family receptor [Bordetella bronchiseptica 7E71]KDC45779.1 tripartite tricarboxylate transporter family receptor [Bordetella bronchiseptica M85/00/2]KDC58512.1 tripartite tricarboxylate transporter family receptor [Bordetella bronchiseptica MBORD595]KDC66220.1 tripartite tricarboxylate transporter family receptor [Bordetella bronchiseptica MBORD624]KDC79565.